MSVLRPGWTRQPIATVNLGRGVGRAEFMENVERIREAWWKGPFKPVIGFCEIDEADSVLEHAALRRAFPGATWAGWPTLVPILVPPHLQVKRDHTSLGSKGIAHLSPHRDVVEAVLEFKKGPLEGERFATINWHGPLRRTDLSRRYSNECRIHVGDRADAFTSRGMPAFITADGNWRNMPPYRKNQRMLLDAGIDHVVGVPEKARTGDSVLDFKKGKRRRVNLTIDGHDAECVDIWMKARTA